MIESNLNFEFLGEAIKFDETKFYEKFKSYLPNGKGVDFLSMNSSKFIMLEVKTVRDMKRIIFGGQKQTL